ncbi:hypothetical protein [Lederbergia citrea]|uniref:hypothetical protein n=1 Tax=Lederbergia citrea TaxID=2833581 RepID=UPI001BC96ADE|nr:hypothetical protein [Lederbergia citrea]MBS4203661.1 hypothetical protein [Lederbergia citrea]
MKKEQDVVTSMVHPAYSKKQKRNNEWLKRFKFKRSEKTQKKQVRKVKVMRQTPSILPFLQIHEGYFLMKNGVMDILQITTKDLYSMNDGDLQFMLLSQARLLRSYFPAFKEVSLNFPANTEKQKAYWLRKKEKTIDPLRLQFIERKLFELGYLEKERTNREFFLFLYAETPEQLNDQKKQLIRGMQQTFPLEKLSVEKKKDVLFILNNQNSKL